MTKYIDLHVHSTCSDGTLTPEELVRTAMRQGLAAIALTDHDTAAGVQRALDEVERLQRSQPSGDSSESLSMGSSEFSSTDSSEFSSTGSSEFSSTGSSEFSSGSASEISLEIIPGIEISAEWLNKEIHILGLDLDPDHPALAAYQDEFLREKEERNRKIAEKITAVGCPVTPEEIQARFPGAVLGRPHYARFMMEKGFVTSVTAAFNQYLGDNGPCFVGRRRISVSDAVKLILECGGHPVLAHPLQYGFSKDRLESLVNYLKDFGLEGMECYYSRYTATDSAKLIKMAGRHGLFVTGGSDFHGGNKPEISLGSGINGNLQIPYSLLQDAGFRP